MSRVVVDNLVQLKVLGRFDLILSIVVFHTSPWINRCKSIKSGVLARRVFYRRFSAFLTDVNCFHS